jgi:RND family efflux transporter MFP subunit
MRIRHIALLTTGTALIAAACAEPQPRARRNEPERVQGTVLTMKDTTVRASFAASGTAEPVQQATLSTNLMGTVVDVLVHEGDIVASGAPLLRIDASDLTAKAAQISASIADAEAMRTDAARQASRIRALYADSAATRAQLDAAETALARADAGVRAANANAGEVSALTSYSIIRAPFSGVITKRFVDRGAFAAPGTPLLSIQDGGRLRITATATPGVASSLRRGQIVEASIEGTAVRANVEGIVPTATGNLYTINALVTNSGGKILPGSSATLFLPLGVHNAIVVPASALVRQGDLIGVMLRTASGDETRWIRLGAKAGDLFEVSAGLKAGDQIVVPDANAVAIAARS